MLSGSAIVRNRKYNNPRFITGSRLLVLMLFFTGLSITNVFGGDELIKLSVNGGVTFLKSSANPTIGGLVGVRIIDHLRIETGYSWEMIQERQSSNILRLSTITEYNTIPLNLTYELNNFEFVLGSSFHLLDTANLNIERIIDDYDGESFSYVETRDISDNYKGMFFSMKCGVRYNFENIFGIGLYAGYGISNRYKNPKFQTPYQYLGLSMHFNINEFILNWF